MNTPLIRIANLGDADNIAPLFDAYRQFYEKPADPSLARRFIGERLRRAESVILIAAAATNAKLIGFCQLYPTFCSVAAARIFVLYDLFVAAAARGDGAGRALVSAAQDYAARQGAARLDLATAKTNRTAQALYESLGWIRDEVFYVYNKSIDSAAK